MSNSPSPKHHEQGFSLVEMLVAVGLTMVLVTAASYVYLGTRESQQNVDSTSASIETGAFALQIIGRDVLNAGFYPTTMPAISTAPPNKRIADSYPPSTSIPLATTDWVAPSAVYNNPIFGCDGAKFNHVTATCDASVAGAPDSVVINYFTNESIEFGSTVGQRRDCTGADVAPADLTKGDPSNLERRKNTPTAAPTSVDPELPPQRPVFVSNRYALNPTTLYFDGQAISTSSLACGGNGRSQFGVSDTAAYQPLLAGVDDLQITYGVFSTDATRAPDRFYTATEMGTLPNATIDSVSLTPWQRVVAVRVCLITKTLAGASKIADKTGALRSYANCSGSTITPGASDPAIYKRYVQVFGVRNRLNQGF